MTLVYLTLAWLAGIFLGYLLWSWGVLGCTIPGWPFGLLAGAVVLALILWRRRPPVRAVAALLLMLFLGAWRYHVHPLAPCAIPADLAFYNGDDENTVWATVEGVVVGYPDVRDVRTFYRLRAEELTIGEERRPVRGDVLVQAPRFPEYRYGDRLRVSGRLQTPPVFDDFDYRAYLARQGIHSLMRRPQVELVARDRGSRFWAVLYGLRERGSVLLNRILPEPAAALANGMLLGIESGIPRTIDEAFKATGTSHVIVISGSNVALLSGVLLALLGRLFGNRRRAALPTIVGIALYVLLVGADPAALRAGLMGGFYVLAIALGRQSTALISLFASGLVMTLLNPLSLWDVGFQLSFMATLGLILFTTGIQARFEQLLARRLAQERVRQVIGFLNDALIVTLAAQITTLPLVVAYFGRLSLVSLVTNFLILPAQPPIMMGGMATLAAGLLWEPLGRVLAVIPWFFLTYTTAVVRLTAEVPFAWVEVGALGRVLAPVYYAVLFGTLGWRRLDEAGWARLPMRRAVAWAAIAVLPLWLGLTVVSALPDGRLHLFFLPGEDGEAALIITPAGRRVWVWDGRGDGAALAATGRGMLTGRHGHVDLALGLRAAELWPDAQAVDPARLTAGSTIRLDEEVTLTCMKAGQEGAFMLTYGRFRTLLPSTLRPEAQVALLASGENLFVTLLKAPGPGTGAWPTVPFLEATAPRTVLWPEGTTYPPDVVAQLVGRRARPIPPDALLEVITDGGQIWLLLHTEIGTER